MEGLEKVFGRGESNPALLDGLGSGFISQTGLDHFAHLLLGKGLLLRLERPHRNREDECDEDGNERTAGHRHLPKNGNLSLKG